MIKSWSFFQLSDLQRQQPKLRFQFRVYHGLGLEVYQFQRLVEFLQIIDQQMRPRPIDCLNLADNSFFKIEPALPPAENLGHRRLAFERIENRVPHRAMLEVNFAVSPA